MAQRQPSPWIALISNLAAIILALATLVQASRALDQSTETHKGVNSRMDEMIKLVQAQARDDATLKEKAGQALRDAEAKNKPAPPR